MLAGGNFLAICQSIFSSKMLKNDAYWLSFCDLIQLFCGLHLNSIQLRWFTHGNFGEASLSRLNSILVVMSVTIIWLLTVPVCEGLYFVLLIISMWDLQPEILQTKIYSSGKNIYEFYLWFDVDDKGRKWNRSICCKTPFTFLTDYFKGLYHRLFAVPIIWREQA